MVPSVHPSWFVRMGIKIRTYGDLSLINLRTPVVNCLALVSILWGINFGILGGVVKVIVPLVVRLSALVGEQKEIRSLTLAELPPKSLSDVGRLERQVIELNCNSTGASSLVSIVLVARRQRQHLTNLVTTLIVLPVYLLELKDGRVELLDLILGYETHLSISSPKDIVDIVVFYNFEVKLSRSLRGVVGMLPSGDTLTASVVIIANDPANDLNSKDEPTLRKAYLVLVSPCEKVTNESYDMQMVEDFPELSVNLPTDGLSRQGQLTRTYLRTLPGSLQRPDACQELCARRLVDPSSAGRHLRCLDSRCISARPTETASTRFSSNLEDEEEAQKVEDEVRIDGVVQRIMRKEVIEQTPVEALDLVVLLSFEVDLQPQLTHFLVILVVVMPLETGASRDLYFAGSPASSVCRSEPSVPSFRSPTCALRARSLQARFATQTLGRLHGLQHLTN
nr:hypothetical protein HmN_000946300 [Hymenolepis microstoma]